MGFLELFILAIGVSMDAFAVSVCKGLSTKKAGIGNMAKCGIWFGGFQALMPLIGFFLGSLFAEQIERKLVGGLVYTQPNNLSESQKFSEVPNA